MLSTSVAIRSKLRVTLWKAQNYDESMIISRKHILTLLQVTNFVELR